MTPEQYRIEALRTEFTPHVFVMRHVRAQEPYDNNDLLNAVQYNSRLLHAAIGVCTETGELQDWIKKDFIYGKVLDRTRVLEELGDKAWYINLGLDAIGATWSEMFDANIAKLRVRFPDKFTSENALNRDDVAEYDALAAKPVDPSPSISYAWQSRAETLEKLNDELERKLAAVTKERDDANARIRNLAESMTAYARDIAQATVNRHLGNPEPVKAETTTAMRTHHEYEAKPMQGHVSFDKHPMDRNTPAPAHATDPCGHDDDGNDYG